MPLDKTSSEQRMVLMERSNENCFRTTVPGLHAELGAELLLRTPLCIALFFLALGVMQSSLTFQFRPLNPASSGASLGFESWMAAFRGPLPALQRRMGQERGRTAGVLWAVFASLTKTNTKLSNTRLRNAFAF